MSLFQQVNHFLNSLVDKRVEATCFVLLGVSYGVLQYLIKYISQQRKNLINLPIYSPSFLNSPEASKLKNQEVLMKGRLQTLHGHSFWYWTLIPTPVYIADPSTDAAKIPAFFPFFSKSIKLREGTVEKTNLLGQFFELLSLLSVSPTILSNRNNSGLEEADYLIYNDQVLVKGKLSNVYKNNNYFSVSTISLGGLNTAIERLDDKLAFYKKYNNFTSFWLIFLVVRNTYKGFKYAVNKLLSKNYRQVTATSVAQKCQKCTAERNVIALDCLHFALCYKCVEDFGYTCCLCKQTVTRMAIVKDVN